MTHPNTALAALAPKVLIFGETHFYSRLEYAHTHFTHGGEEEGGDSNDNNDGSSSASSSWPWSSSSSSSSSPASASAEWDDDSAWSADYDGLHSFGAVGVLLLWLVLPFSLQASALITENMVVPILVVETVRAHVQK